MSTKPPTANSATTNQKKRSRFPRHIRLPFGYVAVIKQVPYEELLHRGCEEAALWDVDSRTLLLDDGLSLVEKRYWVMSQLHHILLDANHEMLDNGTIAVSAPTSRTTKSQ